MRDSWINRDLVEYVSKYPENQRNYVLESILKADVLNRFIQTPQGRLMLNSIVASISDNIANMLVICTKSDNADDLRLLAMKVKVAYEFMHKLAVIAEDGIKYEEDLNKQS
jgi:hypothetical protein